jgi:hypothetical protein
MKRVFAAASLAAFAAGLWGCASAPPPPRPAPEPPPATEPAPPPASVDVSWLVTSKSVNVRETASTKTPTVARLNKGARLTSFEEKDGWLPAKLHDLELELAAVRLDSSWTRSSHCDLSIVS